LRAAVPEQQKLLTKWKLQRRKTAPNLTFMTKYIVTPLIAHVRRTKDRDNKFQKIKTQMKVLWVLSREGRQTILYRELWNEAQHITQRT
jgi:hypothetical protein